MVTSMSVVPFARAKAVFRASEMSITLLGATGSIGTSTIDLVRAQRDRFRVEAVTAPRSAAGPAPLARGAEGKLAVRAGPGWQAGACGALWRTRPRGRRWRRSDRRGGRAAGRLGDGIDHRGGGIAPHHDGG